MALASLAAHQCHVEGEGTLNFPHVPEGMVIVQHRQAVRAKNLELKCSIQEVIRPNVCPVVDHITRLQVRDVMPARKGLRLLVVSHAQLEHVGGADMRSWLKPHVVKEEPGIIAAAVETSRPESFSLVFLKEPVGVFARRQGRGVDVAGK